MSQRLKEKRESLLAKSEQLKTLLSGGNDLTSDELKKAGDLQAEVKALTADFEAYKSLEATVDEIEALKAAPAAAFQLGTQQNATETGELDRKTGQVEGIKGMSKEMLATIATTSYNSAWKSYMLKGRDGIGASDLKILQDGIDSSGGFLVPEQIQRELIQKKPAPTAMAGRVSRYQTGRDSLTIPKVIYNTDDFYQSAVRMTKTGEIPTSATAAQITDPVFGQVRIDVYTHMATGQITRDMLEDGLFNVQGILVDHFTSAKNMLEEVYIVGGTGSGQPTGIVALPGGTIGGQLQPAAVPIGTTAATIPDGLIKLAFALPPQYDDNCAYAFNKTNTAQYMMSTLKDTQNRYLFAYGMNDDKLSSARPKELVGYPFVYSVFLPNMVSGSTPVSNAYPVIFGDFSGYAIVERVGLSIQVLDQTAAKLNQIELVGRWRFGGQTLEEWKLKVGQIA